MKKLQVSGVLLAGAVSVLVAAQSVLAQAAKVTAIKLNRTNSGFNVLLETTGDRAQVVTSRQDNALVADIENAQLSLPQGKDFRQANPAPGIDLVVVSQLDDNSVRMIVTSQTGTPSGEIAQRNPQGITLSISPGSGTTAATPARPPAAKPQPRRSPTAQKPLVPNPEVTVDGKPALAPGTAQAQQPNPVPPTLPRAVAPPVGDIAISNADSSPTSIDLGSNERVPRLVLRDAPAREVLALLARAANLNLAFTTAPAPGGQQQGQPAPADGAAGDEGPRLSLDIQDESVQDVFNYVLRITGLQANRSGRTIFVGPRLPNEARDLTVRSFRLNQVSVESALNFLVAMGAESAVSRERTVTSVNAVPVGGAAAPATQTQTSTETRIETQRIDLQDSLPLLRGLEVVGDERTNAVTLIGSPKQVEIAASQLVQLDARRRQAAVNVKIVDVNLSGTEDFNTSFSFGIGDSFFSNDAGAGTFNSGGVNPPSSADVRNGRFSPPVTDTGLPEGDQGLFLDPQPDAPFGDTPSGTRPAFGSNTNPLAPGVTEQTDEEITFELPTLFQYPRRFLSRLEAQVTSGNAKILTDPTLTVQEGQTAQVNLTAEVFAGTEIQYVTANTGGDAIPVERPVTKDAGLTLLLRIDRIDDNGFINLSVAPTVSAPTGGSATTSQGETITLLTERSLSSGLIRLRDGQTLILSGIIQDQDRTTVSKVPILGDIPILGALFRSTSKENTRNEVIVLLTPQILDDSQRSASQGYNYNPSPEARQLLERNQNRQAPGNNPQPERR